MATFVLDLSHDKVRSDVEGEGTHIITIGDTDFELPTRVPVEALMASENSHVTGMLRGLFGDQLDDALAAGLGGVSFDALSEMLQTIYGPSGPESGASSVTSTKVGKRSRPTSKDIIASISEKKSSKMGSVAAG